MSASRAEMDTIDYAVATFLVLKLRFDRRATKHDQLARAPRSVGRLSEEGKQ